MFNFIFPCINSYQEDFKYGEYDDHHTYFEREGIYIYIDINDK